MNATKNVTKAIRFVIVTLVTVMIFGTLLQASAMGNDVFVDVPASHWAYEEVMQAYSDGAVQGTGYADNGKRIYDPNGKVTMAQFIAILTRAFYPESVEFSDETEFWYSPNYDVANFCGFFDGVPNNAPGTEVTREVMAQIMYNLIAKQNKGGANIRMPSSQELQSVKNKIPDIASVNASMQDTVATCYYLNLLTGIDSSGSFAPKGLMNRAQTAVIYVRLKDVIENGGSGTSQGTSTTETPSETTTSGTLTNGEPVTEENVLALMEEYKNGKTPGTKAQAAGFTSYANEATYDAYNPSYYSTATGTSGTECAKFAFAFWDDLFGDLPAREVSDFQTIRPGDLLHFTGHWAIATTDVFSTGGTNLYVRRVDGGASGEIGWGNTNVAINTGRLEAAYTRYLN